MTQKWEIRYYITEGSFQCGCYAFKEILTCDRAYAVRWAQNKIKYSSFKYFDILQIQ